MLAVMEWLAQCGPACMTILPRQIGFRTTAYSMLALVMLFWAGNSIVGRAVVGEVPPFTLAFIRWSGASALLLPFAWAGLRRDWAVLRATWPVTLVLGLLGVAAFNGFLYSGLTYTTASNALLMQAAIPTLVLLFDWLAFGTRARARQVIGTSLSVIGIVIVAFRGDLLSLGRVRLGSGEVLVLCGVVAWAAYTVGLRKRPDVSGTSFLAATFAVGVAVMGPLAFIEAREGAGVTWSLGTAAALGYVAVFPSLIAYLLFNRATQMVGPGISGHAIALMPLLGAVLASLLLAEPLRAYHWVGMMLIIVGLMLGAFRQRDGRP